jgi:hypothetical protein
MTQSSSCNQTITHSLTGCWTKSIVPALKLTATCFASPSAAAALGEGFPKTSRRSEYMTTAGGAMAILCCLRVKYGIIFRNKMLRVYNYNKVATAMAMSVCWFSIFRAYTEYSNGSGSKDRWISHRQDNLCHTDGNKQQNIDG